MKLNTPIALKNPREIPKRVREVSFFENLEFGYVVGSLNLGILESWTLGILKLGELETLHFETLDSNNSIISRLSIFDSSWLMAQG